jgi:putative hemolysin
LDAGSHLLLLLILIVAQTLLMLAYGALTNVRQTTLREQGENDPRTRRIQKLLNARARLSLTVSLCRTLLMTLAAVWTAQTLIFPALASTQPAEVALGYGLVALLALGMVVLGDMVPEAIGSSQSDVLVPLAVPFLQALLLLFAPITSLLLWLSRLLASFFGSEAKVNTVTEAEIMTLVNEGHTGGTIEEEEKEMIYSVLQLDQTWARELMTPRLDIVALDEKTPLDEALRTFIASGFSRIPIYEENIDNIVGLLYAKDLLPHWKTGGGTAHLNIRDLVRSGYFVPETKRADELLRELQNRNVHMAIVVDEYGGTSGLVTIENLIEEIVGDIRDEFDMNEEEEYTQSSEDEFVVDASMDIDDFNSLLGVSLHSDDNDTVGGYIYTTLGRMPMVEDVIETEELTLRVRSLDGRRIRKVQVILKHPTKSDEPEAATDNAASSEARAESEDTDLPGLLPNAL